MAPRPKCSLDGHTATATAPFRLRDAPLQMVRARFQHKTSPRTSQHQPPHKASPRTSHHGSSPRAPCPKRLLDTHSTTATAPFRLRDVPLQMVRARFRHEASPRTSHHQPPHTASPRTSHHGSSPRAPCPKCLLGEHSTTATAPSRLRAVPLQKVRARFRHEGSPRTSQHQPPRKASPSKLLRSRVPAQGPPSWARGLGARGQIPSSHCRRLRCLQAAPLAHATPSPPSLHACTTAGGRSRPTPEARWPSLLQPPTHGETALPP